MTKQEIDALAKAKKANPEAGRRTLSTLTGVSVNKVQAWLEGRAVVTPAKAPKAVAIVPQSEPSAPTCGISLKNARVSDFKPQDTVKRKLYELKRGTAYPLPAVSEQWGISEERIRKEARRFECLKFVEVKPGDWVTCVIHPETAAEIQKQRKV